MSTNRAPLRKIIDRTELFAIGSVTEKLECGHTFRLNRAKNGWWYDQRDRITGGRSGPTYHKSRRCDDCAERERWSRELDAIRSTPAVVRENRLRQGGDES